MSECSPCNLINQLLSFDSPEVQLDSIEDEVAIESSLSSPSLHTRRPDPNRRFEGLMSKYGLQGANEDWKPTRPNAIPNTAVLRVEKPVRVRIRYTCHMCQSLFRSSRSCPKCQHQRCNECSRHPPKSEGPADWNSNDIVTESYDAMSAASSKHTDSKDDSLPPPRFSIDSLEGEDEGSRPILQRAKRVCHKCRVDFEPPAAQICSSCGHSRCYKCPREIASIGWPYPEDEGKKMAHGEQKRERVYRRPRQRVRWICEQCQTVFMEGARVCSECLHNRCDRCTRIPYVSSHSPSRSVHYTC